MFVKQIYVMFLEFFDNSAQTNGLIDIQTKISILWHVFMAASKENAITKLLHPARHVMCNAIYIRYVHVEMIR